MPKRTFACTYPGCAVEAYHRHCVRCPNVVTRRNGVLCCQACRDLDKAGKRQSDQERVYVSRSLSEKPTRTWLPSGSLPWNRGPK